MPNKTVVKYSYVLECHPCRLVHLCTVKQFVKLFKKSENSKAIDCWKTLRISIA